MEQNIRFVDMLEERRKDCDFLWASRPMDPLLPHKLPLEAKYTRNKIIDTILSDIRVKLAINIIAKMKNSDAKSVINNARDMADEMASKAHLATVRWLALVITKAMKRMFLRIYINEKEIFTLKKEMQISQAQYIYVPSHRSYLDFILLSYILFSYDMALPNIASGMDFYNMKIVGEMLRKTGAFYMRRSFFNDLLYKEVFRSYINTIVGHSDRALEFFIEGTRSRNQKSIMPKYGLLSMILESLLQGDVPDIYFVPMSISYERPPEELLFVYEMLGVPKPKESTIGLVRSLSVLQKSHGCIFFNIGKAISAREFINVSYRKTKIISPSFKIPTSVIEDIAYTITESHKKNTVLMPIHIIALLFNERIQIKPKEPYTFNLLVKDYQWFKNFVTKSLNALVCPKTEVNDIGNITEEILESLKIHNELIMLDSSNTLKLKQRYKGTELKNSANIKGHTLLEQTMQIAIPALNIAIYINPTMAFLTNVALITATIGKDGTQSGEALERYKLLRTLLKTEFVMRPFADKNLIKTEWEESLNILLSQNCLYITKELIFPGNNNKLFSILHNIILPFIDVVYVICILLFEWNEVESGELTDRVILIEAQKKVEKLIFEKAEWCQHPYCLSLDLFSVTLSNLLSLGIIVTYQKRNTYRADKVQLAYLIDALRNLPLQRPGGTYVDGLSSIILSSTDIKAKL